MKRIAILCLASLGLTLSAKAAVTMKFENVDDGALFPIGTMYDENGMRAISGSDFSESARFVHTYGGFDPEGNGVYFSGPQSYIEFQRFGGGTFDLLSLDLWQNGAYLRWVETSSLTKYDLPYYANYREPGVHDFISFPDAGFSDITWFRVYTDYNGTLLDNVTVELTDPVAVPAPGALLLAGMGTGLVGWLRKRRTL